MSLFVSGFTHFLLKQSDMADCAYVALLKRDYVLMATLDNSWLLRARLAALQPLQYGLVTMFKFVIAAWTGSL